MKTNIKIKGFELKTSSNGKDFLSIDTTSHGKLTCWDKSLHTELPQHMGKEICIELVEKSGFKNITKYYGDATTEEMEINPGSSIATPEIKKKKINNNSFYVSYAKDVFVAIAQPTGDTTSYEIVMKQAIDLVKQAIKGFEDE